MPKHINDVAFFYCLFHGICMECLLFSVFFCCSEHLDSLGFWCCSESKHGNIWLSSGPLCFGCNNILRVCIDTECPLYCCHVISRCWRMCLINYDCKSFIFHSLNLIGNIREFLDCCDNDFCVAAECIIQVCRCAPFVCLSGAGRMLDEIVLFRYVLFYRLNQFCYAVKLMISRKDIFLFFLVKVNEIWY